MQPLRPRLRAGTRSLCQHRQTEQNLGAVALDDLMIDKLVLDQAENVLAWSTQVAEMEAGRSRSLFEQRAAQPIASTGDGEEARTRQDALAVRGGERELDAPIVE